MGRKRTVKSGAAIELKRDKKREVRQAHRQVLGSSSQFGDILDSSSLVGDPPERSILVKSANIVRPMDFGK